MTEFSLRKATKEDIKNVFNLSNEEFVRQNSINKAQIKWEDHIKWYNERLKNENYLFLIIYNKENNFLGQIRFEIKGKEALISISVSKEIRGKGLASEIIKRSSEKTFKEFKNLKKILAYIKPVNIPSIKAFEKADFEFSQEEMLKGELFNLYVLTKTL